MSGYILRENDPSIVLTADQVDRLVKNGDGDAALLYLLLMRADRGITEQELQSRLRWSQLRLNAAETGLQRLGLIQRPAETPPPAPAGGPPPRRRSARYTAPRTWRPFWRTTAPSGC